MKTSVKQIFEASSGSIMDLFDVGFGVAVTVLLAIGAILTAATIFFIRSAPPNEITISAGAEGGAFQKTAVRYARILEENEVKVKILTSQGSSENLKLLKDPSSGVDLAMVQAGVPTNEGNEELISLGSISQQPLLVFYRGKPMELLSELKNKRIAIGPEGSGANQLATSVLALSGLSVEAGAKIQALGALEAAKLLQDKKIDVAFIMSESAPYSVLKELLHSPELRLYHFKQASAYVRKLSYLTALNVPEGVFDIGANIPASEVALVGPTVDLIARKSLHPALSDLILEAATQIHGRPGIFQQRGEFPAPLEHAIRISDDAARYYKSGKGFLYRYLPYWLASLLSRILVVFVPALVITIPTIRAILAFFSWRVKNKIYQRYRELVALERALQEEHDPAKQALLQKNFDRIETAVYAMRVKGSYADQIYGLRGHIDYVKRVVGAKREGA